MKGIRKLFLGLVLLTLFGVGFKIDAKAAFNPTVTLTDVTNWSSETTKFEGSVTFTAGNATGTDTKDFPTTDTATTYCLTIREGNNNVGSKLYVSLRTTINGADYSYSVGESTVSAEAAEAASNPGTNVPADGTKVYNTFSFTREQVRGRFDTTSGSDYYNKSFKMHVLSGDETTSVKDSGTARTVYYCKIAADLTDKTASPYTTTTIAGVTVSVSPQYLLPGESARAELNVTRPTSYDRDNKLTAWIADTGLTKGTENISLNNGTDFFCNVTLNADATNKQTVHAQYLGGRVTLTNIATVSRPSTTTSGTMTFTGQYASADVYKVFIDDTEISKGTPSTGTYSFTVPNTITEGNHYVYIQMTDGNWFRSSQFTVQDTSNLTWKSTSALSDGVAVTNGKSIYIYHFLSTGATRNGTVALSSPASDYASVTAHSSGVIGNAQLNGTKAMTGDSGKKDKITLTPTTGTATALDGKVTVYPHISISTTSSSGSDDSLNSGSSSSNSKDTPIKITSPTYVYYGDTDYKVNKLKLTFKGPSGTESRTLDGPSSDSSTSSLSWSASVDSIKLSKILKEVCDSSSNDVTLSVTPYNGDTADDNMKKTAELRVYKINLDGGGGAKYTVNGEDMGDYFYAVKGARYTIKAQPKLSGDKFLNWDNNVFSSETGGDFTASESRTFRANYQSSSSSSGRSTALNGEGSGGSGDDYDDVPKTGESKTDIWILWSVLFISILGAGFMIWKRFGLARAIAEADAQVAHAEYEEQVKAAEKEKKDKLNMLKDLRNL